MVTALVLLNVERDKINSVAEKLTALPGVTEVSTKNEKKNVDGREQMRKANCKL